MARSAHDSPRMGYLAALAMLVLAVLFPIGLMVFNPDAHVRAGLGAVRRHGHLPLGGPDPGARALEALAEREGLRRTRPGCSSTSAVLMRRSRGRTGSEPGRRLGPWPPP